MNLAADEIFYTRTNFLKKIFDDAILEWKNKLFIKEEIIVNTQCSDEKFIKIFLKNYFEKDKSKTSRFAYYLQSCSKDGGIPVRLVLMC